MSYQPKVYRKQGAAEMVVASGGKLTIDSGGSVEDATGAVERYVDVTIPTASVLALFATPYQLVAAPGAGRMLIFCGAILYKAAGTAYGTIGVTDDLAIKYTNASGIDVGVAEMTGFADQATAQVRYILPQTGALAEATISDFTPVANAALVAHMLVSEITTGDSDFKLRVYYRNVPSTL